MMNATETLHVTPEERERVLERIRKLTTLLDSAVEIPGIKYRIGLDPVLGLIPGVGDAVSFGVSAYILLEAKRLGVSGKTLTRMLGNLVLDALVGTVPVAGDFFDAVFKANKRNLKLLTREFEKVPRGVIDVTPK